MTERPRLLIFVIAYYAEKTLKSVLERVPRSVFQDFECEVLVVDDASEDRTFEIGHEYKAAHPEMKLTVLRNELNQGYGGNQKVGYQYAINHGFDFVAMVHGDGQYAPEELPRLLGPLANGEADLVHGSRMVKRLDALKGGMPLYKWVGNQVLTTAQNVLLRTHLSEFHTGYRIYSTAALKRVPFLLNSNDFHFDTEIIIQMLNAGQRIVELPIPTYYGDEISRVNGMKYAGDVMVATLRNVLHRSGVLYQRRFDPLAQSEHFEHYTLKLGYPSSHQYALDAVPDGAKVLDIGGGPGGVAGVLAGKGCEVAVVDQNAPLEKNQKVKVVIQDLDDAISFEVEPYQYLLLLDVVEHLKDPEGFLDDLRSHFTYEKKTLVLSTPNVAFFVQRLMLLFGQFNYGKVGILDRTHTRLFTFRSLKRLLRDSGFKVRELKGVPAPFPKVFGDNAVGRGLVRLNQAAIRVSKTLFSYQIFVVAESTPDVNFVLENTERHDAPDTKLRPSAPRRDPGQRRARTRGVK